MRSACTLHRWFRRTEHQRLSARALDALAGLGGPTATGDPQSFSGWRKLDLRTAGGGGGIRAERPRAQQFCAPPLIRCLLEARFVVGGVGHGAGSYSGPVGEDGPKGFPLAVEVLVVGACSGRRRGVNGGDQLWRTVAGRFRLSKPWRTPRPFALPDSATTAILRTVPVEEIDREPNRTLPRWPGARPSSCFDRPSRTSVTTSTSS